MSKRRKKEKPYTINWTTDLPYRYSMGKLATMFFKKLKEQKQISGSKCPKCGKVFFPPRAICADCFTEMTELIEISNKGTLKGFTIVNYPFVDPQTGNIRKYPYGYAVFKLDGADTFMMHFIDEKDPEKLKVGQRVEAVFKDEREGNFGDIPYFKVIQE
jgi:uncharacterized OB-fold protein